METNNKTNPLKAAKEKREAKLKTFLKLHPKEKKFWTIEELSEFSGNKTTIEELNEACANAGFSVKILIKPIE